MEMAAQATAMKKLLDRSALTKMGRASSEGEAKEVAATWMSMGLRKFFGEGRGNLVDAPLDPAHGVGGEDGGDQAGGVVKVGDGQAQEVDAALRPGEGDEVGVEENSHHSGDQHRVGAEFPSGGVGHQHRQEVECRVADDAQQMEGLAVGGENPAQDDVEHLDHARADDGGDDRGHGAGNGVQNGVADPAAMFPPLGAEGAGPVPVLSSEKPPCLSTSL